MDILLYFQPPHLNRVVSNIYLDVELAFFHLVDIFGAKHRMSHLMDRRASMPKVDLKNLK